MQVTSQLFSFKMASTWKKRYAAESQSNKITGYLKQTKAFDATSLVRSILDQLISHCDEAYFIAPLIANSKVKVQSPNMGDLKSEIYPWIQV